MRWLIGWSKNSDFFFKELQMDEPSYAIHEIS